MLSAFLSCVCTVEKTDRGFLIILKTENYFLAKMFYDIIKQDFGVKCTVSKKTGRTGKGGVYLLTLSEPESARKILHAAGVEYTSAENKSAADGRISAVVVKSACCKKAYTRGMLLACGGVCNPRKAYHAEFVMRERLFAEDFVRLLENFELSPRMIARKGHFVVYFKDGGQIAEVLNIAGAHNALMKYENVRVLKDVGNSINRHVNFETANVDKTISAAVKQVESINCIKNAVGLSSLSEGLREVALLRLEYPEMSLKEIGERLNPVVGKSGVNHRLRKIRQIAEKLQKLGL